MLAPRDFNTILSKQRDRLSASWGEHVMESNHNCFRDFKLAVIHDQALHELQRTNTTGACSDTISFEDSWAVLQGKFRMLEWFCGGWRLLLLVLRRWRTMFL